MRKLHASLIFLLQIFITTSTYSPTTSPTAAPVIIDSFTMTLPAIRLEFTVQTIVANQGFRAALGRALAETFGVAEDDVTVMRVSITSAQMPQEAEESSAILVRYIATPSHDADSVLEKISYLRVPKSSVREDFGFRLSQNCYSQAGNEDSSSANVLRNVATAIHQDLDGLWVHEKGVDETKASDASEDSTHTSIDQSTKSAWWKNQAVAIGGGAGLVVLGGVFLMWCSWVYLIPSCRRHKTWPFDVTGSFPVSPIAKAQPISANVPRHLRIHRPQPAKAVRLDVKPAQRASQASAVQSRSIRSTWRPSTKSSTRSPSVVAAAPSSASQVASGQECTTSKAASPVHRDVHVDVAAVDGPVSHVCSTPKGSANPLSPQISLQTSGVYSSRPPRAAMPPSPSVGASAEPEMQKATSEGSSSQRPKSKTPLRPPSHAPVLVARVDVGKVYGRGGPSKDHAERRHFVEEV